jgi:hypothetical protein
VKVYDVYFLMAAAATGAMLAACSGSSPSPAVPAVPSDSATRQFNDRTSLKGGSVLYAAYPSGKEVAVFGLGKYKKPNRTITSGIDSPTGEAVDAKGNLYVANSGSGYGEYGERVVVYAPGGSTPIAEYGTGGYYGQIYDPWGIAVSKTGTLYVADNCCNSYHSDSITVFPSGSYTKPSQYLYLPDYDTPYFLAVDAKGDLFATDGSGPHTSGGHVYEFKAGSSPIDLGLHLDDAWGIAIDKKHDLVVADPGNGTIDVFPPKATEPSRQIPIPKSFGGFEALVFTKNYKTLFASFGLANSNNDFFAVIDYKTGKVTAIENPSCSSSCSGIGLAVSPAAMP